jgi:hypothetical protein
MLKGTSIIATYQVAIGDLLSDVCIIESTFLEASAGKVARSGSSERKSAGGLKQR